MTPRVTPSPATEQDPELRKKRYAPSWRAITSRAGGWLRAELAGDHHLLDLVGPLADREDLGVAIEAAHGVLLDVAVAAVYLDGLVTGAHGQAARLQLRLGRGQREVLAAVLHAGGLVDQQAGGLD